MTTLDSLPTVPRPVPAARTEPRPRFRDLLAAEWFKLWSMRSMRWGYGLGAVGIVWLSVNSAVADVQNWDRYPADMRAHFVPGGSLRDAFTNNAGITVLLVAGVLGAMTLVSEYASGLIRVSFAAVPARRSLLAAKIAVLTAVMLAFGVVVTFSSFGLSEAILSSKHAGISLTQPGIWSALTAAMLLPAVSALVGLGLAAVIRHSAATVVAVVTVLLLIPDFLSDNHYWSACLDHAMPFRAFQTLYDLTPYQVNPHLPYPAQPAGEWWVYLLWPLVSVIVALVLVDRRDV
ncbi:ABC transporter permease [Streptacidiphilus pinicola]|uniref:ABC transporter permease n=1 Tax=Streptacidiphilus pinicola TaxID=2219663 RepID=A0A2X0J8N0_9ACTN|nr:ABC transporter permease subunit [Streptacidiphilus pinicola]RAG83838.1 ABC transporter permease [Streptacidiphilus pinicola]